MKNIEQILTDHGITVTADQLTAITKDVNENYKTIADYTKQKDKLTAAEDKVNTLTASLDQFKGVDPEALNKQITDLQAELKQKDTEYSEKIAARDFEELLKDAIGSAKGKNVKAIKALLDLDTLKKSKNLKEDVAAALKFDDRPISVPRQTSTVQTGILLAEKKVKYVYE